MLEMERKVPVSSFDACAQVLARWGARAGEPFHEADHYFNAPDRDFARTDEALRIRRIGSANFVTYKGPKQSVEPKTRTELEVALAPGPQIADDFGRLLVHLGYRPVAVVRKERQIHSFERDGFAFEVCFDEVAELGRFVEVEILVPEERQARGREILDQVVRELGLTASEPRSYLEMLLARRREQAP